MIQLLEANLEWFKWLESKLESKLDSIMKFEDYQKVYNVREKRFLRVINSPVGSYDGKVVYRLFEYNPNEKYNWGGVSTNYFPVNSEDLISINEYRKLIIEDLLT